MKQDRERQLCVLPVYIRRAEWSRDVKVNHSLFDVPMLVLALFVKMDYFNPRGWNEENQSISFFY
jgi:hypothetical protein